MHSAVDQLPELSNKACATISKLDATLLSKYQDRLRIDTTLNRHLVSFQSSKKQPSYRWFKYKEGFSPFLVESLLSRFDVSHGILLDPFAGSGTSLFAASSCYLDANGIELLPIGQEIIRTRLLLRNKCNIKDKLRINFWLKSKPWRSIGKSYPLPELRITKGAYPSDTVNKISRYLALLENENEQLRQVLRFALLCVLEEVSYTRKDGQYLRWDYRSGRRQGEKKFDKGAIYSFDTAICKKLKEIVTDIDELCKPRDLFESTPTINNINLYPGSCLDVLPELKTNSCNAIFTSPPYCNRYDYTRTYALELAVLGINEDSIMKLRQSMLSCTVENRAKDLLRINPKWSSAISATRNQNLLQSILEYLETEKLEKRLNNVGIPRMVKGYFEEMACVISECHRVLKNNSYCIVVNDNVRYAGTSISVDLILTEIAENIGYSIDSILQLPIGKGNSSQQMGFHGREPLRKCVYVWRKK